VSGIGLIDTSALLAIANPRDQYHSDAVAVVRRHVMAGGRFLGSVLVLGELHGHLLHRRGPAVARRILTALLDDSVYEWVEVSAGLIRAATSAWLERHADQGFSLTDAVSFELMRTHKVAVAFAYDDDFRTAGFQLAR
jgi:predicted nucleic acid-binding protein